MTPFTEEMFRVKPSNVVIGKEPCGLRYDASWVTRPGTFQLCVPMEYCSEGRFYHTVESFLNSEDVTVAPRVLLPIPLIHLGDNHEYVVCCTATGLVASHLHEGIQIHEPYGKGCLTRLKEVIKVTETPMTPQTLRTRLIEVQAQYPDKSIRLLRADRLVLSKVRLYPETSTYDLIFGGQVPVFVDELLHLTPNYPTYKYEEDLLSLVVEIEHPGANVNLIITVK